MPALRLAEGLEAAGHQITLLTCNYNKQKVLNAVKLSGIKGDVFFPDEHLNIDFENYQYGWNKEHLGKKFMQLYADEKICDAYHKVVQKVKPDLGVVDAASGFGYEPFDKLGLPVVVQNTFPLDIIA